MRFKLMEVPGSVKLPPRFVCAVMRVSLEIRLFPAYACKLSLGHLDAELIHAIFPIADEFEDRSRERERAIGERIQLLLALVVVVHEQAVPLGENLRNHRFG